MSQRNNPEALTVGTEGPASEQAVVSYALLRRVRHPGALRRHDGRRRRLETQLKAELNAFELGCITRGTVELAEIRHVLLLQAQVDRCERAPQLLTAAAPVEERLAACAALSRWLYGLRGCWTQSTVASYLNNHGQRTRHGRPWTQPSVSQLLSQRTAGER